MTGDPATCSRRRCPYVRCSRGLCSKHYRQELRDRRARGDFVSGRVDARRTIAYVRELQAAGLSYRRIGELSGVHQDQVFQLCKRATIYTNTARRILAVPMPAAPHHPEIADGRHVPALGAQRRLRALVAIGYSGRDLCQHLGMGVSNETNMSAMMCRSTLICASMARRVDVMFRELQLIPGGKPFAIARARRNGWAPPLAWDEDTIDDPAAKPNYGADRHVTFLERYKDAKAVGKSDEQIAKLFGVHQDSLERQLMRYGLWEAS